MLQAIGAIRVLLDIGLGDTYRPDAPVRIDLSRRIYGIGAMTIDWHATLSVIATPHGLENIMTSQKGPNIKKKQKCKNCEGKGLLKKGDKVVKCQRCGGTGLR